MGPRRVVRADNRPLSAARRLDKMRECYDSSNSVVMHRHPPVTWNEDRHRGSKSRSVSHARTGISRASPSSGSVSNPGDLNHLNPAKTDASTPSPQVLDGGEPHCV